MQFSVDRKQLVAAMQLCIGSVETRTTMPILSHVWIGATDNDLVLQTTDLELSMRAEVPAKVKEPGAMTVPAKMLLELASRLAGETFDGKSTKAGHLSVTCGPSKARMNALDASGFPGLPEPEGEALELPGGPLAKILKSASYAASEEASRFSLNALRLTKSGKSLIVAGTDGHRMAKSTAECATAGDHEWLLPLGGSKQLVKILESMEPGATAKVYTSNNLIWFQCGSACLSMRRSEGNFPDIDRVLPKSFKGSIDIDRSELSGILSRAELFVGKESKQVKKVSPSLVLKLEQGRATFSINDEFEESIGCDSSLDMEMYFQIEYIAEAVKAADSGIVRLSFNDPTQGIAVESAQGVVHNYGYLMPRHSK